MQRALLGIFVILGFLVGPIACDNSSSASSSGGETDASQTPSKKTADATKPAKEEPKTVQTKKPAPNEKLDDSPVSGPSWSMDPAELEHNFGAVWQGVELRHAFEFKNVGNETLRILEAKPRCSCSVAQNYTKVVEPGQTGSIPFVLKTQNKHGPVEEYLTIKLNDPAKPEMTIYMRGEVRVVCDVRVVADSRTDPADTQAMQQIAQRKAYFGDVDQNEPIFRVLQLRNTSGNPSLDLKLVRNTGTAFTGTLEVKRPGQLWEFTVLGKPPYEIGYNTSVFNFQTNIPDQPMWSINATCKVPDRIEVIPSKIVADESSYKRKERTVKITNNGKTPVNITAVSCSGPDYKVTYLGPNPEKPNEMQVEVILPPGEYFPPPYGEIVRVETDDPEKSIIEIIVLPDLRKPATPRPADKPLEFYPGKLLG